MLKNKKNLEERDTRIFTERQAAFLERTDIKEGDFIRFADGTYQRITHVWTGEQVQTAREHSGSFYLGNGYMSYSGGLLHGVKPETLTRTNETRDGYAWFFHNDYHQAYNGIDILVTCPVWLSQDNAPTT